MFYPSLSQQGLLQNHSDIRFISKYQKNKKYFHGRYETVKITNVYIFLLILGMVLLFHEFIPLLSKNTKSESILKFKSVNT